MEPAVALYLDGLATRIAISGHGPIENAVPEWRTYLDYARKSGVPDDAIILEKRARNTLENFTLSALAIGEVYPWETLKRVAICCKPVHARRAYMTARQHLPDHIEFLMLPPVHPADIQAKDWWQTPRGRARVFNEIERIGLYGLKGDISIE